MDSKTFSNKHTGKEKPDPLIKVKITSATKTDELPCAVAFNIAKELNIHAAEVGKSADLIRVRLTKCQLGLFGYTPQKKIVKRQDTVDPEIKAAIEKALVDHKLTCENAWNIATKFDVHKMTISNTCESMGIKINKCQLGAF